MSSQTQEQAADPCPGPQEGEVYTLRSVESQNTLCLPADTTGVGARGPQKSQRNVQRVRVRPGVYWHVGTKVDFEAVVALLPGGIELDDTRVGDGPIPRSRRKISGCECHRHDLRNVVDDRHRRRGHVSHQVAVHKVISRSFLTLFVLA